MAKRKRTDPFVARLAVAVRAAGKPLTAQDLERAIEAVRAAVRVLDGDDSHGEGELLELGAVALAFLAAFATRGEQAIASVQLVASALEAVLPHAGRDKP